MPVKFQLDVQQQQQRQLTFEEVWSRRVHLHAAPASSTMPQSNGVFPALGGEPCIVRELLVDPSSCRGDQRPRMIGDDVGSVKIRILPARSRCTKATELSVVTESAAGKWIYSSGDRRPLNTAENQTHLEQRRRRQAELKIDDETPARNSNSEMDDSPATTTVQQAGRASDMAAVRRGASLRQHIVCGLRSTFARKKRPRLSCLSASDDEMADPAYGYQDGDVTALSPGTTLTSSSSSTTTSSSQYYSCCEAEAPRSIRILAARCDPSSQISTKRDLTSLKIDEYEYYRRDKERELEALRLAGHRQYGHCAEPIRIPHRDEQKSSVRFRLNSDDDDLELDQDLTKFVGDARGSWFQMSGVKQAWVSGGGGGGGRPVSGRSSQSSSTARPLSSANSTRRIQSSQVVPTVGPELCATFRGSCPQQQQQQQQLKCRPRRALTEYEAAEIADYPDIYYAGEYQAVIQRGAASARSRASKQSTFREPGAVEDAAATGDAKDRGATDVPECYDDKDGFYINITHDHIAYRYEVFKVLGRGSFGEVVRAFDHKLHRWVAIKIVRSEERFRRQAGDEVRTLKLLRQADVDGRAHVVRILDHFDFRRHPCIVFESLGVDLYEALRRRKFVGLPLGAVRRAAVGIARCLCLLKSHRLIHCDLKPENVLLMPSGERRGGPTRSNLNVKVIDFGSSCFENDKLFVYVQSRFYRAPEVILSAGYGTPVDMWSFGCILVELVTGHPLFAGDNEADQLICQMEFLGVPPQTLLGRSKKASLFFSTSTGLPRYCSVVPAPSGDPAASGEPTLTGSTNRSGTYRCPPGTKNLTSLLMSATENDTAAEPRQRRAFVDFVRRCLEWDPAVRMTPDEALRHAWMQSSATSGNGATRLRPQTTANTVASRARPAPSSTKLGRPGSHGDENVFR